jgi:hypothetical protein
MRVCVCVVRACDRSVSMMRGLVSGCTRRQALLGVLAA